MRYRQIDTVTLVTCGKLFYYCSYLGLFQALLIILLCSWCECKLCRVGGEWYGSEDVTSTDWTTSVHVTMPLHRWLWCHTGNHSVTQVIRVSHLSIILPHVVAFIQAILSLHLWLVFIPLHSLFVLLNDRDTEIAESLSTSMYDAVKTIQSHVDCALTISLLCRLYAV